MKTNDNIGVLFDTSFFIRLVNEDDPLFDNAFDYFEKFSQINFSCKISSIALAEYLVKGKMDDLPDNLSIVAFNRKHAVTAGDFMRTVLTEKQNRGAKFPMRTIVPNDTKMFAQAHSESDIKYFVSADSEAKKVYDMLPEHNFEFIDINISCKEFFKN
jgi:predicted nucleic acid-binding protein